MKIGLIHTLAGFKGCGKTTFAKQLLKVIRGKKLIFDLNNEYSEFNNIQNFDFKEFKEVHLKNAVNSVIVIDEATIFLNSYNSKQDVIIDLLVRTRHNHNYIIFVFHSISDIPNFILRMSNILTLFKTNEPATEIKKIKNNPEILKAFNILKKNLNKYDKINLILIK